MPTENDTRDESTPRGDEGQPRVLIQGKLRFTRKGEDDFMEWVESRRGEVKKEMGWRGKGVYQGWLWDRQRAWREYENDFEHRKTGQFAELFRAFNTSVNIPKRGIRVLKARACEQLLNSEPFAGFMPEGEEDEPPPLPAIMMPPVPAPPVPGQPPMLMPPMLVPPPPAPPNPIRLAERLFHDKLKQGGVKYTLRDAIEQCAVSGETVLKINIIPELLRDRLPRRVWTIGGAVVSDEQGQPLHEGDEFEEDTEALDGRRLKRAPTVKLPREAVLSDTMRIRPPAKKKRRLEIKGISYEDFGCSPGAEDIQTTDMIWHDFDWYMDQLYAHTQGLKLNGEQSAWREKLRQERGMVADEQTEGQRPAIHRGEEERHKGEATPSVLTSETWVRYFNRETGTSDEIYVLWDVTNRMPIFYDYAEEVSPIGIRPFQVMRICPVRGRWYGTGFYQLLSNEHPFIDRQFNRIDARNSASGRFTWTRQGAIVETRMGIPFNLAAPRVWTIDQSVPDASQAFGFTPVPSDDENIWQMFNMMVQSTQLMMGTVTPGDADAAKLNQSNTLGGQQMLAAESELMSGDTMQDLIRGIEGALKQAAQLMFTDFDEEEARTLLGNDNAEILIKWLSSTGPNQLLKHIKLLLTKTRSTQQMQANQQAAALITGGMPYISLVAQFPQWADQLKPLYQRQLESLDVQNAGAMLSVPRTPPLPPIGAEGEPLEPGPGLEPGTGGGLPAPAVSPTAV